MGVHCRGPGQKCPHLRRLLNLLCLEGFGHRSLAPRHLSLVEPLLFFGDAASGHFPHRRPVSRQFITASSLRFRLGHIHSPRHHRRRFLDVFVPGHFSQRKSQPSHWFTHLCPRRADDHLVAVWHRRLGRLPPTPHSLLPRWDHQRPSANLFSTTDFSHRIAHFFRSRPAINLYRRHRSALLFLPPEKNFGENQPRPQSEGYSRGRYRTGTRCRPAITFSFF